MSESTRVPSARNSTLVTPTLSEARAASATEPVTVAPVAGAVRLTVGAVVSGAVGLVTLTVETVEFPAASYAVAVIVCDPAVALEASQVAA